MKNLKNSVYASLLANDKNYSFVYKGYKALIKLQVAKSYQKKLQKLKVRHFRRSRRRVKYDICLNFEKNCLLISWFFYHIFQFCFVYILNCGLNRCTG